MSLARSIALTAAVSVLLAALAAWGGATYAAHHSHAASPLHELIHEKMHLTDDQQRRIEGMEKEHATRQEALQREMRAANLDLARGFAEGHTYTEQVQAAVDRFHHAMGELQKETILHVLAMRTVLTPEQAAQFDSTVDRSLTEDRK